MMDKQYYRPVRSYVRRLGRITKSQKAALTDLGTKYLVNQNTNGALEWPATLDKNQSIHLEIGIGMGEHLLAQASRHPEVQYIGIDVHEPGIGHVCRVCEDSGLSNVQLYCGDVKDFLKAKEQDIKFARIDILFPDPWHKKKHQKRRLIQPDFIEMLLSHSHEHGELHIMTDWGEYAEHIETVLQEQPRYQNITVSRPLPADRVVTKFERKGCAAGRTIHRFVYAKYTEPTHAT